MYCVKDGILSSALNLAIPSAERSGILHEYRLTRGQYGGWIYIARWVGKYDPGPIDIPGVGEVRLQSGRAKLSHREIGAYRRVAGLKLFSRRYREIVIHISNETFQRV